VSAHWHAHVILPGKPVDRSPPMSWEKAKAFKLRCAERWSKNGRITADRRGTLGVVGAAGTAWVKLVPCVAAACIGHAATPVADQPLWSRRPVSARAFLLEWAAQHGGQIARADVLAEAPRRGASASQVANLLHGDELVERVGRGVYRLRERSA